MVFSSLANIGVPRLFVGKLMIEQTVEYRGHGNPVCKAQVLQPWSAQAIESEPGDWCCQVHAMDSEAMLTLRAPVPPVACPAQHDLGRIG